MDKFIEMDIYEFIARIKHIGLYNFVKKEYLDNYYYCEEEEGLVNKKINVLINYRPLGSFEYEHNDMMYCEIMNFLYEFGDTVTGLIPPNY